MKEKMMNAMLSFASKLQTQRHMSAIKNAFTALLPIVITGSFCTLFLNVLCSTTTDGVSLAKVPGFSWLENLSPIFNAANYATMNFMAIGIVILIALELGKHYGRTEFTVPVIAVACYVSLCDTFTLSTVDGAVHTIADVLPRDFTNAQGLFLGMIVAIVSVELYCKLFDSGKLEIRMPDSVPPTVAKAFNALFPALITIFLVSAAGFLFHAITGMTLFNAVSMFIQKPLQNILTGLPGYIVMFFMTTLLWVFGIHGTQVLGPIYQPMMYAAMAENLDAAIAGTPAPHILNIGFVSSFSIITGAGITGGLIIAILLFSKRDDYKTIAKIGIPCAVFNINEPLLFGLPIVLNPLLMIPFMLSPAVSAAFAYFMTDIGFAKVMTIYSPWTTPPGLMAFLNTEGHIGTAIVQLLCIGLAFLIYTPFVLMANKQQPAE